ncbi:PQQ-like beta-propeller repeat protein [Sandaracinus amylolyticus]|uniref:PQQ-like beta-propeller repeat protein n=1 Tax=Sandaracinus amylolyticus TaxID=927083 RepID=UPI001F334F3B|nr:PQQ-like beta-propeller repeat protein [Sandaracinus amylolyticus]UJR83169.1 Hypothetical protein I5071_52350 [Sandaracinus amylolyticus]
MFAVAHVGCGGNASVPTASHTTTERPASAPPPQLAALWHRVVAAEHAWLSRDTVVIHHRGGVVWGRDARTGASRWIHGYAEDRTVDADDDAVLVADPGEMTCLDPRTGEPRWSLELERAETIDGLAIAGPIAAIAYRAGPREALRATPSPSHVRVLALADGATVADHAFADVTSVERDADRELVIVRGDPSFAWVNDTTLAPVGDDACFVTDDVVLAGPDCGLVDDFESSRRLVEARSTRDATTRWTRAVHRTFPGPVVLHTSDAVLLASEDGELELVDLETGASRWTLRLDEPVRSASGWIPAAAEGTHAVLGLRTSPARLVVIDLARGVVLREVLAPSEVGYLQLSGGLLLSFTDAELWVAELD